MKPVLDRLAAIWREGRRIVFLGVGSPIRADDAVGLLIVAQLEQVLPSGPDRELAFYLGESAPENFSGAIREFGPSHVVLFDAADLGREPGSLELIEIEQISGTSFSTHMLPLKVLANYLTAATGCEVVVVGVQPKNLEFDGVMSPEVEQAALGLVDGCKKNFIDFN